MHTRLTSIALALLTPALHAQGTVYIDESFDSGIPTTWTIVDTACPATNWYGTTGGYGGSSLDGTEFAFIDSDAASQFCAVEDYLESPVFDPTGSLSLVLTMDHYYKHYVTDVGTVQVFDGRKWVDAAVYTTNTGAWGAPDQPTIDLTAYINPIMQVRFKYTGNWDWYWAVDNVMVFDPTPPPTIYCTAKVNSQGCTPTIGFSGLPSVSSPNPFIITATNHINNKFGLLFYGISGPDNFPFQGGTMCVKFPIVRTFVQSSGGNPPPNDCSGVYSFDFNAHIQSGIDATLIAGRQVNCQFWCRDPGSATGSGFSDAVQFVIGV